MATFAALCLAMGTMPSQLTTTLAVLLPKPSTGFRTIGLFPSLYRVVIRQQYPRLQAWEMAHPHPAFSFQGGTNALHRVWCQAAKAEFASSCKGSHRLHTGAALTDMSDYFERIHRGRLRREAQNRTFPRQCIACPCNSM